MTINPNGWSGGSGEKLKYLGDEQVEAFFTAVAAARNPVKRSRDLCLFSLMLAYGLRCAEVPLLQLEHVRLREYPERSEIYVTRVKKKRDKKTGLAKPRDGRWYLLSDKNRLLLAKLPPRPIASSSPPSERSACLTSMTAPSATARLPGSRCIRICSVILPASD
jgi:integrase